IPLPPSSGHWTAMRWLPPLLRHPSSLPDDPQGAAATRNALNVGRNDGRSRGVPRDRVTWTCRRGGYVLFTRRSHMAARRDEDLAAALALLRVRHRLFDVLDSIDRLDRGRQDPLRDLLAELGVDGADLLERAGGERPAEGEADQLLGIYDQRAAGHHRLLAAHRAIVAHDAALADTEREPERGLPGHGVEPEADRRAARVRL